MRVTRFPKDPGPAAWAEILPKARSYPPLHKNITADVLIIGAGFAGLTAAARAIQLDSKLRVVVLEARHVAQGPAGRNSGFMIDLPHNLTAGSYDGADDGAVQEIALNRHGIEYASGLATRFDMPNEAFDPSGKVNGAASAKGLAQNQAYAASLEKLGEASEVLDALQMQELTGSSYYLGGLFTPGTAILQPALYIQCLADGISHDGVMIHEQSAVQSLNHDGNWVAKTDMGQVSAKTVILAVNGHLQSFGFHDRDLMHVFTYASMTRKLSRAECKRAGGQARWGVTPADPMGSTVRRISGLGGDRIVVRNRFTFDPTLEISDAQMRRITNRHNIAFQKRFPSLSDVGMEYRWAGRLCLTRNHVSTFGLLQRGLISACTQNGLGTAKGTLHGKLAAELALGQTSPFLDEVLAEAAPKPLPPEPFAFLGANATLAWHHWRAGREV